MNDPQGRRRVLGSDKHYDVAGLFPAVLGQSETLAKFALPLVSHDRVSNRLTHHDPEPSLGLVGFDDKNLEMPRDMSIALLLAPFKIFRGLDSLAWIERKPVGHLLEIDTVRRLRPLRLLWDNTFLPEVVFMRLRKPWVRFRLTRLG